MSFFDKVSTAKELLESTEFSEGQSWFVQDILPKSVVGLVVGPEKSMKSSVTQDLAQAVSTGTPFAGKETNKANVLIIQNENSRMTEHQRLEGSKREATEDLFMLHGGMFKLDIWDYDKNGKRYNVGVRDLGMFIVKNNIGLVILDPLKDLLDDDETINQNQPMNSVLAELTKLKNGLDVKSNMFVTILIVAHARKQSGELSLEDKAYRVKPSHVLGATAIPAWYEVAFTMSPKINTKTNNGYSIMQVKARNFAYDNEIMWGYIGNTFTSIDAESIKHKKEPDSELIEEVKQETPDEVTTDDAKAFLELAKDEGKVNEVDD